MKYFKAFFISYTRRTNYYQFNREIERKHFLKLSIDKINQWICERIIFGLNWQLKYYIYSKVLKLIILFKFHIFFGMCYFNIYIPIFIILVSFIHNNLSSSLEFEVNVGG